MLTGLVTGVQILVLLLATMLDPTEQATKSIQSWVLIGLCSTLVIVVGYFLKSLHQDFRQLVNSVQHIEKTVIEHGAKLEHHHDLLKRLDERE